MSNAATLLILCCLPVVSAAQTSETLPAFGFVSAAQLRQVKASACPRRTVRAVREGRSTSPRSYLRPGPRRWMYHAWAPGRLRAVL